LLYIAFNTALGLAIRTWAVPFFKRLGEQREQAKDELRRQLGREPTDEELAAHLLARHQATE
jgi:DNA-directed RNA polymerase specialized sigma subunit